jgi:hypothetical protein
MYEVKFESLQARAQSVILEARRELEGRSGEGSPQWGSVSDGRQALRIVSQLKLQKVTHTHTQAFLQPQKRASARNIDSCKTLNWYYSKDQTTCKCHCFACNAVSSMNSDVLDEANRGKGCNSYEWGQYTWSVIYALS